MHYAVRSSGWSTQQGEEGGVDSSQTIPPDTSEMLAQDEEDSHSGPSSQTATDAITVQHGPTQARPSVSPMSQASIDPTLLQQASGQAHPAANPMLQTATGIAPSEQATETQD